MKEGGGNFILKDIMNKQIWNIMNKGSETGSASSMHGKDEKGI
jgi:hypothetical protein